MKVFMTMVRHGESDFNAKGILQGQLTGTDTSGEPLNTLSSVGREQAASKPLPADTDYLVASDLPRAYETAFIMREASGYGGGVALSALLRERSLGVVEGMTREQLAQNPELAEAWRIFGLREKQVFGVRSATSGEAEISNFPDVKMPGGETEADVQARVRLFLDELVQRLGDSVDENGAGCTRVVAVTHLGVIRAAYQVANATVPQNVTNLSFSRFVVDVVDGEVSATALGAPDDGLGAESAISL